jgi:large subunit ribosomal protein L29
MKAEELRGLGADELGGRLKGARRELYELRFKLAVGQLDNHREIRKARKEIARILSVVHQRRLEAVGDDAQVAATGPQLVTAGGTRPAERVAEPEVVPAEPASAEAEGAGSSVEPAAPPAPEATAAEATAEGDQTGKRRRARKTASEDEE